MAVSLWIILKWGVSDTSCRENQNTRITFNISSLPKIVSCMRSCRKIWWCHGNHRWRGSMAHARCTMVTVKRGYRRSEYVMRNCVFTVPVVPRTRLIVTLYAHCLSCYVLDIDVLVLVIFSYVTRWSWHLGIETCSSCLCLVHDF